MKKKIAVVVLCVMVLVSLGFGSVTLPTLFGGGVHAQSISENTIAIHLLTDSAVGGHVVNIAIVGELVILAILVGILMFKLFKRKV